MIASLNFYYLFHTFIYQSFFNLKALNSPLRNVREKEYDPVQAGTNLNLDHYCLNPIF